MEQPPVASKACRLCGDIKPLTEFPYQYKSADGRQKNCRDCASKIRSQPDRPSKRCTACGVTKPAKCFSDYSKSPDGLNGECRDCMGQYHQRQAAEQRLNSGIIGPVAPPEMSVCCSCNKTLPIDCFHKAANRSRGVRSECKSCRYGRLLSTNNAPSVGYKVCRSCGATKSHTEFGRNRRSSDGLTSYCADCNAKRHASSQFTRLKLLERDGLKHRVMSAYGGKCSCCGESNVSFLSIDHIDGVTDRSIPRAGDKLWRWLERNNYPKDNFQCMCYNCNLAKGFYGECPHDAVELAEQWRELW